DRRRDHRRARLARQLGGGARADRGRLRGGGLRRPARGGGRWVAHALPRAERFRNLYLETTRERGQEVSVLFSDLAGFTSFAERSTPSEVATVLYTYYAMAAPLISRRFGGELEKFMGDGMMATFNSRGDQPDHA